MAAADQGGLVEDYLLSPAPREQANAILHVIPCDLDHPARVGLVHLVRSPLALASFMITFITHNDGMSALRSTSMSDSQLERGRAAAEALATEGVPVTARAVQARSHLDNKVAARAARDWNAHHAQVVGTLPLTDAAQARFLGLWQEVGALARAEHEAERQAWAARIKAMEDELDDTHDEVSDGQVALDQATTRIAELEQAAVQAQSRIDGLERAAEQARTDAAEAVAQAQARAAEAVEQAQARIAAAETRAAVAEAVAATYRETLGERNQEINSLQSGANFDPNGQ